MKNCMKIVVAAVAAIPAVALAHVGGDGGIHHVTGFLQGFIHPLTGLDHLFAMTLVGVWSAMNTQRWWLAPLSFAALLLVGAFIGMAGVSVPATEHIVAASLLGLGLMVALQMKLSTTLGASIVGGFAVFHGLAHGAELSHSFAALSGMVSATALLHLLGLALGYGLLHAQRSALWSRAIGTGSALLGVGLLSGLIA